MSDAALFGLVVIVLGGILVGTFTLPMKFAPRWPWEATWLVYSLTGLFLFPIAIAVVTLPPLSDIYLHSSLGALTSALLFGFGWGIGAVLFGIGVDRLGISLGFSIILGLSATLGSIIPMLVLTPREVATSKGAALIGGLVIVLTGIYVCGKAGIEKERSARAAGSEKNGGEFFWGVVICVLSGILASMLNFAMAFGQDIARRAIEIGATVSNASNAIWVLAVTAGAIANVSYCALLLVRNGTFSTFREPKTFSHWMLGTLMGALWFGGITVYGSGASALGTWGSVLGWPLFMAIMIVTANAVGWLTGEWRDAPGGACRKMLVGLTTLGMGIVVVGYSSTL